MKIQSIALVCMTLSLGCTGKQNVIRTFTNSSGSLSLSLRAQIDPIYETDTFVSGWAQDTNRPNETLSLTIQFDNNPATTVTTSTTEVREDGNPGFRIPIPESLSDGSHEITIVSVNGDSTELSRSFTLNEPLSDGAPSIMVLSSWSRPLLSSQTYLQSIELRGTNMGTGTNNTLVTDCDDLHLAMQGGPAQGFNGPGGVILTIVSRNSPSTCSVKIKRSTDDVESNAIDVNIDWFTYDLDVSLNGEQFQHEDELQFASPFMSVAPYTYAYFNVFKEINNEPFYRRQYDHYIGTTGSINLTRTLNFEELGEWTAFVRAGNKAKVLTFQVE